MSQAAHLFQTEDEQVYINYVVNPRMQQDVPARIPEFSSRGTLSEVM